MNSNASISKRKIPFYVYHLAGWLFYFNEDIIELFTEKQNVYSLSLMVSYQIILILIFYGFLKVIWPRTLQPGRYLWAFPGLLFGVICFILLRYFIQEMVFPAFLGFSNYNDSLSFGYYIKDNFRRPFELIFLCGIIYLLMDQWKKDKRSQILEKAKIEAELALLRSQINPHFLFNMLGYLHTEAFLADKKLAGSILQLSNLLRYTTQKSLENKASLSQEIEHLTNYLDLMGKRFGEKCYINLQIEGLVAEQRIEPFLFLPFVENAFKHGIYTDPTNAIQVELFIQNGQVTFSCNNKINHHQKDPGSGIGIQNVRKRLELLYPGNHNLEIKKEQDHFFVALDLTIG